MDPFIGEIKMVGFNFAPKGYAFCNGALMSISQNSALFSLLGTTFGGDGVQTFGLPDYRSRSPVGMGTGPGLSAITQGEISGQENTTLLLSNMPAHSHTAMLSGASATPTAFNGAGNLTDPTDAAFANTSNAARDAFESFAAKSSSLVNMAPIPVAGNVQVGMAGSGMPVALRNHFLGTNFIIATEGVYPSLP
jgi:microcystin-dependent protein